MPRPSFIDSLSSKPWQTSRDTYTVQSQVFPARLHRKRKVENRRLGDLALGYGGTQYSDINEGSRVGSDSRIGSMQQGKLRQDSVSERVVSLGYLHN